MTGNALLGGLTLASLGLGIWQWLAARRFPLHRRVPDGGLRARPVTVLKPLKGCDTESRESLRSWFTQAHGAAVQLLFGVDAFDDPVVPVVRELIAAHPQVAAQLIICPQQLGANAKASKVAQLVPHAAHDWLVMSDADVWVPPDFLSQITLPLERPEVGLVNCFYRLASASTLAMHWEAVAINSDFWSQVLQSRSLQRQDFALGAAMALRRADLEAIGGMAALAGHLADDFHLGRRIVAFGRSIELCPVVVDCREPRQGWRTVWTHQLRWARTIRSCRPLPYALSVLANGSFWPFLWMLATLEPMAFQAGAFCLFARAWMAFDHHRRISPGTARVSRAWLPWIKDLLQVVLWAAAFLGDQITWRGEVYRVHRGGLLEKPESVRPAVQRRARFSTTR
jgi:ceramide glucosyltransferase